MSNKFLKVFKLKMHPKKNSRILLNFRRTANQKEKGKEGGVAFKDVISKLKTTTWKHRLLNDRLGESGQPCPHSLAASDISTWKDWKSKPLKALKEGGRWQQQYGISPNSSGIASHFDDVRSVSCCSETLKGRLCFPLHLFPLCLPLSSSLTLSLPSEWRFSLRESTFGSDTAPPPSHEKSPTTTALCVVTNYIPPPVLCPPCNSIFPWNLRDHPRRTYGHRWCQIETVHDRLDGYKDLLIKLMDKIINIDTDHRLVES